jgi:ABC-type branched-subunit amino acid transport system substrate-binding protein
MIRVFRAICCWKSAIQSFYSEATRNGQYSGGRAESVDGQLIPRDFDFKDYITQAGGFTDNARQKRAYVVYANGLKDRTKRLLFFRKYPKIEPGSRVIVPFKPLNR